MAELKSCCVSRNSGDLMFKIKYKMIIESYNHNMFTTNMKNPCSPRLHKLYGPQSEITVPANNSLVLY